ncbi:hypothetical protein RF55_21353, partial [Lasius niger]
MIKIKVQMLVRAKKLVDSMVDALNITAPRKEFRIPKMWVGKKWFSKEIKEAATIKAETYQKALYANTEESWRQFKIKRNMVVKLIKKKKKEYYEDRIDGNKENPTDMWKTLKELIRGESAGKKKSENIYFEELENVEGYSIADKFNLYCINNINDIVQSIDEDRSEETYIVSGQEVIENFERIEIKHLHEIIMGLPRKKDTEEGITSDILKAAFGVIKKEFVNIINSSLEEGNFPEGWKTATIQIEFICYT